MVLTRRRCMNLMSVLCSKLVSKKMFGQSARVMLALGMALVLGQSYSVQASSHREAPYITEHPKVDGTDYYSFRSYEPGRAAFSTFLANYIPLQNNYGGPSYFTMDPEALYE